MHKLIIIGSTSNICKIRAFKNINKLNIFDKIYCYGWECWSTNDFRKYLLNEVNGDTSNLLNNVEFIKRKWSEKKMNNSNFREEYINIKPKNEVLLNLKSEIIKFVQK